MINGEEKEAVGWAMAQPMPAGHGVKVAFSNEVRKAQLQFNGCVCLCGTARLQEF